MAKPLRWLMRRTLFKRHGNLLSLDDPFSTIGRLLAGRPVAGILDAGASDGHIARRLLGLFPKATAYPFEPHPNYTAHLQSLAQADPRLKPQAMALSDESGTLELHETQWLGQTSQFRPTRRLAKRFPHFDTVHKTVSVPVVRLDDWAQEQGVASLDVMKFDIQAGELKAMRGGRRIIESTTLAIYTEVFFSRMYEGGAVFGEIDEFLRGCGFMLYNIYRPRSDDHDVLTRADALFVHAEKLGL